jgi:hypothetical protein
MWLPGSITTRRRACVDKAGASMDEERKERHESKKVLRLAGLNQIDIKIAIHDGKKCVLCRKQKSSL